ncbi:MAG: hypothetical protein FWD58_09400 [Firmicutes bacterium]|nr:hypothetical protein [Bacillota bacterium]
MEQQQFPAILMLIGGDLLNLISKQMQMSHEEAARLFYASKLYEFLEDESTKLWHFSVETLFSMLDEELSTGNITFPEEQ